MWRDVAEPVGGLVDEPLIVRRVEDRRFGRFGAAPGAVSQTLVCATQRHRPRNVATFLCGSVDAHGEATAPRPPLAIAM
jgi:hypothetical protein